jgi:hypothetical protein
VVLLQEKTTSFCWQRTFAHFQIQIETRQTKIPNGAGRGTLLELLQQIQIEKESRQTAIIICCGQWYLTISTSKVGCSGQGSRQVSEGSLWPDCQANI